MFRKLTSTVLMVTFIAMTFSGLMMLLLGDFAFQLKMHPVHNIFGILMTVSGCFHIYFNYKAILNYLGQKKNAVAASVFIVLLIILSFVGMNKTLDPDMITDVEKIISQMQ